MPTHDFVDIGDVLDFELLQGEIKTIDTASDTCTVSVGGVVYSAVVFYHCEPTSTLRSNGAIQDGATGFQIGDQVFVMKKKVASPVLSEVKVVGHVTGCRHCSLSGSGYYVFYKSGDDFKVARCLFGANGITVAETKNIDDIGFTQLAMLSSPAVNPLTWHAKKFRHKVMTNGIRTERDLYCVWSSVYFNPAPFGGWTNFAAANPAHPLVTNNLNTEITYSTQLMTDLQTVNYSVNHAHAYVSDPAGNDNWEILGSGESGDCEDFVLTKAQALLALGYPASALHIEASEIEPDGGTARVGGHAWLVVQTTSGDYALDLNSDTVVLNSSLTFGGRAFTTRRRQIGSNWAFISPFSAFLAGTNIYLGWTFVYILDPVLNILYLLPYDSDGAYRPFLYTTADQEDETSPGSPSINFSEDNNYIYYADQGYIYTYRLDENVLTQVSKVAYASQGWITREGTIKPLRPAEPLPEGHPFTSITDGQIPASYRPLTWGGAEVVSFDGYYDFQYQYYDIASGWFPMPPIQQ